MADTLTHTNEEVDVILDSVTTDVGKLIVHNDEFNTFDWVIQSLVEVCKHSVQQAEQCAMIIHFKGKYTVKEGYDEDLKPMREAFGDRGIGATIEY